MEYYMDTYYPDYLMHYGVKGMKWGHRKKYYNADGSLNTAGQAKQAYKSAKKDVRTANKQLRRSSWTAVGIKGIDKYDKAKSKAVSAEVNRVNAKAKLKSSLAKDSAKAKKAEFNTYKKEMKKSGIRGSAADVQRGGRSTELYNSIRQQKGKAYADRIEKRVQNEAYATFAASAAVMIGANVAAAMMNR